MPVLASAGDSIVAVYALFDSGASCSAVSSNLVNKIAAPISSLNIHLGTFDNQSVADREVASFVITDLNETIEINVNNALIGSILSTESESPPRKNQLKDYPHLADLPISELEHDSIDIILDAKYAHLFLSGEVRRSDNCNTLGIFGSFGWSIIGEPLNESKSASNLCIIESEPLSLSDEIRRMFRHDFIMREGELSASEACHLSANDKESLKQIKDSIVLNPATGHYEVSLPWKLGRSETAKLFKTIDFYGHAKSRHEKLKRKLQKDPELRAKSFEQMNDTIAQGHVTVLQDLSAPADAPVCYLPTILVTRDDKPGKVRICLDAAARSTGHSLNEYLHSGPDYLNNLVGVLLRFRRKRVVLVGDIKEFFKQMELNRLDAPAFRSFWWDSESMEREIVLESRVHIFGAKCSPSIANIVIREHAEKIKPDFPPVVYQALMDSLYVDDELCSVDDVETAIELKKGLTAALASGGFVISKWRSNFPEVLENPDSDSLSQLPDRPPGGHTTTAGCSSSPAGQEPPMRENTKGAEIADGNDVQEATPRDENGTSPTDCGAEKRADEEESESLKDIMNRAFKGEGRFGIDINLLKSEASGDKILGVGWDSKTDDMGIKIGEKHLMEVETKTDMLSFNGSMYDPLGIASPFTVRGRSFFQRVNESGIGWKDIIPQEILSEFNKWKAGILHLQNVKIPRWTSCLGMEDALTDLVIFCDSAATGYGMVSYTRRFLKGGGDRKHVSFLVAKAHVVPLQMSKQPLKNQECHGDSIPRLELVAATLAAEWRDILLRHSGEIFNDIYLFSDSLTVINWINDWERRFRSFENFRIERIRILSQLSEWRHCPTNLNPADIASKGLNADEYKKWAFFHSGPEFLRDETTNWPPIRPAPRTATDSVGSRVTSSIAAATHANNATQLAYEQASVSPLTLIAAGATIEEPNIETDIASTEPWPLRVASKKQSWSGKVRAVALIIKTLLTFREKVMNKNNPNPTTRLRPRKDRPVTKLKFVILSHEEKEKAEYLLVSAIQSIHFEKEFVTLLKLGVVTPNSLKELRSKTSKLTSLSPFLDNNLLRAGGRIAKGEEFSYDTRFPMILPGHSDENVRALIREYHVKNMHCSRIQTYSLLKQRFYILGGKTAVNNVVDKCIRCQRLFSQPPSQRMGDLPAERLTTTAPFSSAGCDVFGWYPVRHGGRGTTKRWVLLATCFSTRAIAMFVLKDMSATTTINALVRLNSQFPGVKKIYSDNGSNFRSADKELKEAVSKWNKNDLDRQLEEQGIEWVFGPAYCGSAGGTWERVIGLVKHLIKAVIGDQVLDLDTFETFIASAAAIMNRRPLIEASADVDDMLVLTPSHFLYPYLHANSSTSIIPPAPDGGESLRKSWNATQHYLDTFWRKWKHDYVTTLLKKSKWKNSTDGPRIGQIVILVEPNEPRETWRLARVKEITNSDATHPRRFIVVDAKGTQFDRHITGLVPLEYDTEY